MDSVFRGEADEGGTIAAGEMETIHELIRRIDRRIDLLVQSVATDGAPLLAGNHDLPVVPSSDCAAGTKHQLPDPRLIRHIIRNRKLRADYFPAGLFADPAWDMLLDLAAARAEFRQVSVTSVCLASGVPNSTALRYVEELVAAGLCERRPDDSDRRRTWIELSEKGAAAVAGYFAKVGPKGHFAPLSAV